MTKTIEAFFRKGGTMADALKHVETVHGAARRAHIVGHLRTLEKKGWKVTRKGDTVTLAGPPTDRLSPARRKTGGAQ